MREKTWVLFVRWMSNFWWKRACPQPDGRFNCWLYGKPYAWTARLHTPWYLVLYPKYRRPEHATIRLVTRAILSLLLLPVGWAIQLANGRPSHPSSAGEAAPDEGGETGEK